MAPKVIASEIMNSHITNFLCGMAKAGASRTTIAGLPAAKLAWFTMPPEWFPSSFRRHSLNAERARLRPQFGKTFVDQMSGLRSLRPLVYRILQISGSFAADR